MPTPPSTDHSPVGHLGHHGGHLGHTTGHLGGHLMHHGATTAYWAQPPASAATAQLSLIHKHVGYPWDWCWLFGSVTVFYLLIIPEPCLITSSYGIVLVDVRWSLTYLISRLPTARNFVSFSLYFCCAWCFNPSRFSVGSFGSGGLWLSHRIKADLVSSFWFFNTRG